MKIPPFFKNFDPIPSGPGAELFGISLMASPTFSTVISILENKFLSSGIKSLLRSRDSILPAG